MNNSMNIIQKGISRFWQYQANANTLLTTREIHYLETKLERLSDCSLPGASRELLEDIQDYLSEVVIKGKQRSEKLDLESSNFQGLISKPTTQMKGILICSVYRKNHELCIFTRNVYF